VLLTVVTVTYQRHSILFFLNPSNTHFYLNTAHLSINQSAHFYRLINLVHSSNGLFVERAQRFSSYDPSGHKSSTFNAQQ